MAKQPDWMCDYDDQITEILALKPAEKYETWTACPCCTGPVMGDNKHVCGTDGETIFTFRFIYATDLAEENEVLSWVYIGTRTKAELQATLVTTPAVAE